MRVSSYVIGAPLPNQPFAILLHGVTGAVDKVSTRVGQYLVENRGLPLQTGHAAMLDVSSAQLDDLIARGYVTSLDHEAEQQLMVRVATTLHENDLATSPTGFMFVPAYRCNLRCPYCFQPHELHTGTGPFSAMLTTERVDQAFAIIDDFLVPGSMGRALGLVNRDDAEGRAVKPSDIGLFGGEPLTELTLPIVTYIVDECQRRGWEVSAITNGVELDRFAHLLGPGSIWELQITLDGLAEYHDRRRVGPGFPKTFNRIIANIEMALARGTQISLRMNIDSSNVNQLQSLWELFAERGWTSNPKFRANASAVTPEAVHKPLLTQAQLVQETSRLKREIESDIHSYERYAQETLERCLSGDGYPFKRVANCAAETGLLMFDPLGDIYACWEDIGHRDRRIATYGAGGIDFLPEVATSWLTRFPGSIEQCSRCPYALIHNSGCANHARNMTGSIFASACESFQEYFPKTLATAYAKLEQHILGSVSKAPIPEPQSFLETTAAGATVGGASSERLIQIQRPSRTA